jgi:hypothetical protein
VYHVTETPASMAISSRRNPFVRRDRPIGRPTSVGANASRRARRNAASSSRRVIAPFDHVAGGAGVVVFPPLSDEPDVTYPQRPDRTSTSRQSRDEE